MNKPPPESALRAFGAKAPYTFLTGGQGSSYISGNLVLKPVDNEVEAAWIYGTYAAVLGSAPDAGIRLPKPVRSVDGSWIAEGWAACEYLDGAHEANRWEDKIAVSKAFHRAVSHIPRPEFLDERTDPWSVADRVAWSEATPEYSDDLLDRLMDHMAPIAITNQVIHGDIAGNILFNGTLPPAVIDFSPYWRPADFAIAVIVVDALVWGGATESIFDLVNDIEGINQLVIFAEARRMTELHETQRRLGSPTPDEVAAHRPAVELICRRASK